MDTRKTNITKPKRLLAAFGAGLIALTAFLLPVSTADAAKGGARAPRITRPHTSPSTSTPRPSTSTTQNARPSQQYKPSQSNQQANTNANARTNNGARTNANPAQTPQSGSRWGSALRNIGMLAGGMFLGSMLANMLGFGGGFMGDILGLVMNGILFFAVFRLIMWAIGKFRGSKNNAADDRYTLHTYNENPYARQDTRRESPIQDIRPRGDDAIPDIRPPQNAAGKGGQNYNARRTADWYRSH